MFCPNNNNIYCITKKVYVVQKQLFYCRSSFYIIIYYLKRYIFNYISFNLARGSGDQCYKRLHRLDVNTLHCDEFTMLWWCMFTQLKHEQIFDIVNQNVRSNITTILFRLSSIAKNI